MQTWRLWTSTLTASWLPTLGALRIRPASTRKCFISSLLECQRYGEPHLKITSNLQYTSSSAHRNPLLDTGLPQCVSFRMVLSLSHHFLPSSLSKIVTPSKRSASYSTESCPPFKDSFSPSVIGFSTYVASPLLLQCAYSTIHNFSKFFAKISTRSFKKILTLVRPDRKERWCNDFEAYLHVRRKNMVS